MSFNVLMPTSEEELVSLLSKERSHILSGGTDLIVKIRLKRVIPKIVVSLKHLKGLDTIEDLGDKIRVGCRVTISELLKSEIIDRHGRIVQMALRQIGSPQIRNRATLAGNIVNASPAGDSIVAMVLTNASLSIGSANGERYERVVDFIKGPGETTLSRGEFVKSITFEKTDALFPQFYKVGQRNSMAISVASVGSLTSESEIRLAFGSVAPTVVVPIEACEYYSAKNGSFDEERFVELAMKCVTPIDDVRATAWYRTTVVRNLIHRTLKVWRKKGYNAV
ncbi:aerobic-type carbon monoxide dehydrogenase, middle subunit CoxM/CutM-like protein [Mesotoga prima MesG1.Ag.4.2]|uniref:Aerobic-type carbon monoxide dehydrogenase, middle subunit CoxM/CutM-like protein n=1 Tax=Mesotoga prima MesG1.Ag.4.2 TaxID=660470 RepID=I2F3Y6_9BACT|nr:FAD binding domain-containing protein [Mesotoga prima]AFK06639.1 aerobic-type carbon monoxide dehydrogenase, middle subunit CoxM/CutM-like protein [Mesotoga prima MesG1.Ag.4.2]